MPAVRLVTLSTIIGRVRDRPDAHFLALSRWPVNSSKDYAQRITPDDVIPIEPPRNFPDNVFVDFQDVARVGVDRLKDARRIFLSFLGNAACNDLSLDNFVERRTKTQVFGVE
jgi:hypothetical protein